MKIAVTGANGHLGNVICRLLIESGFEVNALERKESVALQGLKLNHFIGDLGNLESLEKFMHGCDYLIHSAGVISINGDMNGLVQSTNIQGTQNVLDTAIKMGLKKVIHISSVHALVPPNHNKPMSENHPYKSEKDYAYDYSKAQGEKIMLSAFREKQIEGCVIRPSLIAGPFDFKPSEMGKALIDYKNEKIPVIPPGGFDFVDVRDVARATISAIENGRNGEAYMIAGQFLSMKQLSLYIKEAVGVKVPKKVLPFWVLKMSLPFVRLISKLKGAAPIFTMETIDALKYGHPNIVTSKAKEDLNYRSIAALEILKDFYEWYDNHVNNRI